jgi:hypothetical protein
MSRQPILSVLVAVLLVTAMAPSSWGAAAAPPAKLEAPAKSATAKPPPGVEAAQTLSLITGVAISPLLGVGAVGCYEYIKNAQLPEAQRRSLHWYAQPWFWIPALLLVGLVMLKDVVGPGVPTALKKPMDVAETIENKISGLVAAGAFVPLITQFVPSAAADMAQLSSQGFASLDLAGVMNIMLTPLAIAVFAIVWLASHAINILILLSPFATVDALLKSFRVFLLSLVVGTHAYNPYLGAAFSLVLIVISYFIAGWSFRLMVLGNVFIWDYLTFRRVRFTPSANGNWMFTGTKIEKTPIRTYGRLYTEENGRLRFEYRPWLFLSRRTVILPEGVYAVGRGLFYPEILREEGVENTRSLFILPPRYNTHEAEVARAYGVDVRDTGLLKGFKALWCWLKRLFGFKTHIEPAPA